MAERNLSNLEEYESIGSLLREEKKTSCFKRSSKDPTSATVRNVRSDLYIKRDELSLYDYLRMKLAESSMESVIFYEKNK
jgi:hypothetical protein